MLRGVGKTLTMTIMLLLCGCMEWDYGATENLSASSQGLFIVNEGNFQYGNASLSYYDPEADSIQNEVFLRTNGMLLGDVAQSMTIHKGKGWVVVNHSHAVFAIDTESFKECGRIVGLTSPRYIHFVSDTKAYITQLWDNRIFIVDPTSYRITGHITIPGMNASTGSTEQMVQVGKYVYVNCWSYQNSILKIDSETDKVVDRLEVGIQPNSIVADCYGRLWTITDGGYENSPQGYAEPELVCIDLVNFVVESRFKMMKGDNTSELCINAQKDMLYWINGDIWQMNVTATRLPLRPIIRSRGTEYYGLTVDPVTSDIYIADAIDFQQAGTIYRYDAQGNLKSSFTAGVIPGAFCWKTNQQ